jgi:AAA15 family ATPase/GTPase
MYIENITFSKKITNGCGWNIEECKLEKINLITGKNSSGKTRFLSSIYALSEIMFDRDKSLKNRFDYHWIIELADERKKFIYELKFVNNIIEKEELKIDDEIYFTRDNEGKGKITYESLNNQKIDFEIEKDKLILNTKRDKKQHPSMENIFLWAKNVYLYKFGSTLGRDSAMSPQIQIDDKILNQISKDDEAVVWKYEDGLKKGGENFKKGIMDDINGIGYDLIDIGTTTENELTDILKNTSLPIPSLLYIKENGVQDKIFQGEISQGMFRVLSLIIQIKYLEYMDSYSPCILIDDIGEGLDYERSTKLIKYVIEKAKFLENQIQLIMTTNDRFVMNIIDLEYWLIIDKEDNKINFYNQKNSEELFIKFKKYGLNNFDFFSGEYYKKSK